MLPSTVTNEQCMLQHGLACLLRVGCDEQEPGIWRWVIEESLHFRGDYGTTPDNTVSTAYPPAT